MLPREKYLNRGLDTLSDVDLIAIVVGSGIKGKDFLSVSRSVLYRIRYCVSKHGVISLDDLTIVNGVGNVTAMKILCGIELGRRIYGVDRDKGVVIKNSEDVFRYLKYLARKKQEHVVALFLNSRYELLAKRTICIGSLDGVTVLPRDIIIPALEVNACSVIMVHNHPSGDPTPSIEDQEITKRVNDSMSLVGINMLDHIVISANGWRRVEG